VCSIWIPWVEAHCWLCRSFSTSLTLTEPLYLCRGKILPCFPLSSCLLHSMYWHSLYFLLPMCALVHMCGGWGYYMIHIHVLGNILTVLTFWKRFDYHIYHKRSVTLREVQRLVMFKKRVLRKIWTTQGGSNRKVENKIAWEGASWVVLLSLCYLLTYLLVLENRFSSS